MAIKNGAKGAPSKKDPGTHQREAPQASTALLSDKENKEAPAKRGTPENKPNDDLEINRRLAQYTGWLVAVGIIQFAALVAQAVIFGITLGQNRKAITATQKKRLMRPGPALKRRSPTRTPPCALPPWPNWRCILLSGPIF